MMKAELTTDHVNEAIARSLRSEAYFDKEVLDIPGFSTPTMRRLFSNLCHSGDTELSDHSPRYLEIGVYCGATFCAAINNSRMFATGVENYSQPFGRDDVQKVLSASVERFNNHAFSNLVDGDAFAIGPVTPLDSVDIFFYDGEHSLAAQAKALPHFLPLLAKRFLFIVDDFDWPDVKRGTIRGFGELQNKVRSLNDWTFSDGKPDGERWHNGLAMWLCEKI